MAAANRGAQEAGALSIGLTIDLPARLQERPNPFCDRQPHFHYFFARKVMFVRYASGFVVLPGGVGTWDELFEALTLLQTEKIRDFPLVLLAQDDYWEQLAAWWRSFPLERGYISQEDLERVRFARTPQQALEIVRASRLQRKPRINRQG